MAHHQTRSADEEEQALEALDDLLAAAHLLDIIVAHERDKHAGEAPGDDDVEEMKKVSLAER